ncbi:hypothetical protein X797_008401 [Metarhizium robertsii]|uniref:Uncharacterized protein n=1 Tax=Metarhizium robertsii TaxID=568076 RepID=A0A0A1URR0_9HYPO|nr:hypothetical protein X797_008401 [Metarhizium robertsii]
MISTIMPLSINFDPDCDFYQRRSLARRESPYFAVESKYTIFNAWIRCRDFAYLLGISDKAGPYRFVERAATLFLGPLNVVCPRKIECHRCASDTSQTPDGLADILTSASSEANPALIGKTVFDSVVEQADRAKRTAIRSLNVLGRQAPPLNPRTTSAADASKFNKAGSSIKGGFPRGDARPPSEIFKSGFYQQGNDRSL